MLFLAALVLAGACASGPSGPGPDDAPDPSGPPPASPPADAAATVDPGALYSEEQSERGRELFGEICSECHYVSELRGPSFQYTWRRRSVGDLFEYIAESMPEDRPGTLDALEYADLLAYILHLNGVAAGGEDLPPDPVALEAHILSTLWES